MSVKGEREFHQSSDLPGLTVQRRRREGRPNQVSGVRFTDAELLEVTEAAELAGKRPAGWVAEVALAAARQKRPRTFFRVRASLTELNATRAELVRFSDLLSGAANVTDDLQALAVKVDKVLSGLDHAVLKLVSREGVADDRPGSSWPSGDGLDEVSAGAG